MGQRHADTRKSKAMTHRNAEESELPAPFCMLHLYGDALDPDKVSAHLQIKPRSARREGESRGPRATRPQPVTVWGISSFEHVQSRDLMDHLSWIRSAVPDLSDSVFDGVEDVRLSIALSVGEHTTGYDVPREFVEYAALLKASIGISVEYWAPNDSP
jgi:hypothetical protein